MVFVPEVPILAELTFKKSFSVLSRRQPVIPFEIPHKMTFIRHSNFGHNLFHAQKGGLEKLLCLLHSEHAEVFGRRHAGFIFENLM